MNNNIIDLSESQKRMWTIAEMQNSSAWTELLYKRFKGYILKQRLIDFLSVFLKRQTILTTRYIKENTEIKQSLPDIINIENYYCEFDFTSSINPEEETINLLNTLKNQTINLQKDILYKLILIRVKKDEFIICHLINHTVFDAWSLSLIWDEFESILNKKNTNEPVQYLEYIKDENSNIENLENSADFWKNHLKGYIEKIEFPLVKGNKNNSANYVCTDEILENKLVDNINRFAKSNMIPPLSLYMAAFYILLYKYTGVEDLCIGTILSGRHKTKYNQTIGNFIKMLPIRYIINSKQTIEKTVKEISKNLLNVYKNQDYPICSIIKDNTQAREMDGHPLFKVMLNRVKSINHNRQLEISDFKELFYEVELEHEPVSPYSQFHLTIFILESPYENKINIWYKESDYNNNQIKRLLNNYLHILCEITNDTNKEISKVLGITSLEKNFLMDKWNNTKQITLSSENLYEKFRESAEKYSNNVALSYNGNNITYCELLEKVTTCASYLLDNGVQQHEKIAILLPKNSFQIISVLSVLCINCVYVPIDISYPPKRIEYILKDSDAKYIITNFKNISNIQKTGISCFDINIMCSNRIINNKCLSYLEYKNSCAYIIYTSGSTGEPKGVPITHRNVIRLLEISKKLYNFNNDDVWTYYHSLAFDYSVWEIFGSLIFGGRLVIIDEMLRLDFSNFAQKLIKEKVTILSLTPYVVYGLLNNFSYLLDRIRILFISGDKFIPSKVSNVFSNIERIPRIINAYGITETTIFVTQHELTLDELKNDEKSNIGKPFDDTKVYLLDKDCNPVPIGAVGEIYVSGPGLSNGYLNDAKSDSTGFLFSYFSNYEPYKKIYKTGDLAYYTETGDLIYVCRNDNQIQIRGYRIELEEISYHIRNYSGINDCFLKTAVIDNCDKIIAYIVLSKNTDFDELVLNNYLKNFLPNYMIPSAYIIIDNIPLTLNGKISVEKLPNISLEYSQKSNANIFHNNWEKVIYELWSKYLKISIIDFNDNFFTLGGSSIDIVMMKLELESIYNIDVPIMSFFRYPSIFELSEYIEANY